MSHKLLIVSYYFFPENKPRAFRTFELTKGLCEIGFDVTLVVPSYNITYLDLTKKFSNLTILQLPDANKSQKITISEKKQSKGKSTLRILLERSVYALFPSGSDAKYGYQLIQFFRRNRGIYDTVISISYPYSVHFGVVVSKKLKYLKAKSFITEFGDTLVGCPALPKSIVHKILQKFISVNSNYIVTPTHLAIPNLSIYKEKENVKVIPQGFNFSDVKTKEYKKNVIPTFGYAGSFHYTMRNPEILLELLSTLNIDFRFIIYTNLKDNNLVVLFEKYKKKLGEKLVINSVIPRLEVLEKLSTMDFLVFEENVSNNQSPSKIIDYKLTGRPIFSFHQNSINVEKFLEFLNFNFTNQSYMDFKIEDFSIEKVIDKYKALIDSY